MTWMSGARHRAPYVDGLLVRGPKRFLVAAVAFGVAAAYLAGVPGGGAPAGADTAPADPSLETVSAAALPTVQINGVVWDQVIVGDRVFATGEFSQARPAGAAPGTNETPRSNILAYDLVTGDLITSWAPSLNAQGREIKASADGATIFVGGDFDAVNGQTRTRVAALDAQTGALRGVEPGRRTAPWTPSPLRATPSTWVATSRVLGAVARTRLAAVDASSGALLSWAPAADLAVNTMVFHPATGSVIVGGTFNTLNGTDQPGMGSLDGVSGAVRPWPVNTIIQNHDGGASINSLTTDGDKVYGVGWAFLSSGGQGNLEGAFAADAATGELDWVDGGRGDNYDIAVAGNVLYTVGHPHDWGMLDWNPQTDPLSFQRAMAIDKRRSPTLTNAFGTPGIWQAFKGRPAAQPLHWLPTLTGGTYTGQSQARVERRHERHLHRARRRVPARQRREPAGPRPVREAFGVAECRRDPELQRAHSHRDADGSGRRAHRLDRGVGSRQRAPEVRGAARPDHGDRDRHRLVRHRRHDVVEPSAAGLPRHDRAAGQQPDLPHPRDRPVRHLARQRVDDGDDPRRIRAAVDVCRNGARRQSQSGSGGWARRAARRRTTRPVRTTRS